MEELNAFRASKDEFFGKHPQSPLTRSQRSEFSGLAYLAVKEQKRREESESSLRERRAPSL